MKNLFSEKRMNFYEEYALKREKDALFYYKENIRKSAELYPYMCIFEILLRNKVANHLSTLFKDWYLENSNFNQRILQSRHSKFISHANFRLKDNGKKIDVDGVISELTLGFWCTLFKKTYSQDIWNRFKYKMLFSDNWSKKSIGFIHTELEEVRYIRNRIFHYEQILTYNPNNLKQKLKRIILSFDPENKIEENLNIF